MLKLLQSVIVFPAFLCVSATPIPKDLMPPVNKPDISVTKGAGAKALTIKPKVVVPPKQFFLVWDNSTNISQFTNWQTAVQWTTNLVVRSTNHVVWNTYSNMTTSITNVGPIPANRFWRVGYYQVP